MSTPPDPLPKWLPPGTIARYSGNTYIAKTPCERRGPGYYAVWDGSCVDQETWCMIDSIDWENIPDTGPRGGLRVLDWGELYVPAEGELVQVEDVSQDDEPEHRVDEVVIVAAAIVCSGELESRRCLLLRTEDERATYCLVKPLFEAPAEKKAFDPEAWEQARAEAEAAFGDAPAVEGPSGVIMVNGQAYELKDCQVQIDDYVVTSDPGAYASLEDAVRAKGFVPGDLLRVDEQGSLARLSPAPAYIAGAPIPAGAIVAIDACGRLVPARAKASKVGPVTKRRRP